MDELQKIHGSGICNREKLLSGMQWKCHDSVLPYDIRSKTSTLSKSSSIFTTDTGRSKKDS